MALEILIGPNKVGKTGYLKGIEKERKEKKELVTLFLGVGHDIEKFIKANSEGTGSNKIDTPIVKLIDFINELTSETIEFPKLHKTNQNKVNKINDKIAQFKRNLESINDIFFEKNITSILKPAENKIETEKKLKIVEWNKPPSKGFSEEFSSGTTNYSYFKTIIHFLESYKDTIQRQKNDKFHLIIDEPETFCHPELINKVASEIYKISKIIQVTVATHSPIFLNRIIQLTNYDEEYRENQVKNEKIKIKYFIKNVEKKPQPITIKFFGSCKFNSRELEQISKCLFATNIILYEGLADFLFLHDIIYNYEKDFFSDKYVTFIDCNGRKGVKKIAETLTKLKLNKYIKIIMFYDLDFANGSPVAVSPNHEKYLGLNKETNVTFELKLNKKIEIKNSNVFSIVQSPNLECELFKLKAKNSYEWKKCGTIDKNNIEEKINIEWIKENSTKESVEEIIKNKIDALKKSL